MRREKSRNEGMFPAKKMRERTENKKAEDLSGI